MLVSEALRKIQTYLRSESKKPFFVFADNSLEYMELLNHLHLPEIRISDYCRDDSLPDLDQFYDDLQELYSQLKTFSKK